MIHILLSRWPQFKKQIPAILYICIVQTILNFHYPPYMALESPWNGIAVLVASFAGVLLCTVCFLFPERFENEYMPNAGLFSGRMFGLLLGACFWMWYTDYHHMANQWYALLYAHYAITFLLLYRAIAQYKKDKQNIQNIF